MAPLLNGCAPDAPTVQNEPTAHRGASRDGNAGQKQQASGTSYEDGTYQGTGTGMGGPIDVTLTVADGRVTVDEITESGETAGIGGKEAIEDGTFKAQIEEAQSADIDGVTGATMTTNGVKKAVEEALSQAR
ncbi:hypothetical protein B5F40_07820 [Gordonibacter sp. An230]|nr:hypothetical protein B5F40_07820 [Gordonibacter sp. An230]